MKVLILASGGDAPGMNKIIYNIYKRYKNNSFACLEGFKGLIDGKIFPLSSFQPYKYKNEAGTCIKSSRCLRFMSEEGFKKGLKNAKKFDALIILGGNGSLKGAERLASNGVKVVFVPATIDNDVNCSEYSLGFHTAVKSCCDAIYNIMPSMNTFNRCCIFEVMGRRCDKIAVNVSKVTNPDYLVANEDDLNLSKLSKIINQNYKKNNSSFVIIRENIIKLDKLVSSLKPLCNSVDIKTFVIGHLQRGSKPTSVEISFANKFSRKIFSALKSHNLLNTVVVTNGKFELKKIL